MRKGLPPEGFEWAFTLAALAFLIWQSEAFRDPGFLRGAGDRYRKAVELEVPIAPQAAGTHRVTALCKRYGGWLPDAEKDITPSRTGACSEDARHSIGITAREPADPAAVADLARTRESLARSLAMPVRARLARLDELENRAREARAETDVQGAIEAIAGETSAYRETYGIAGGNGGAAAGRSLPLECAWDHLESRFGEPRASDTERAYALIGLAALFDGDAARASAAASPVGETKAPAWSKAQRDACAALGSPREVVTAAAAIVATARASENNAGKSIAAQELLANAHWVHAAWAAAGLLLLQVGRLGVRAWIYVPFAMLAWSALGWVTHVHPQWISDRAAQTAALLRLGIRGPEIFQVLAAASAILLMIGVMLRSRSKAPAPSLQTPSSRLGYAGFVLFTGLGWWLLLDLSATGHYANRFHALYQQVYVFAAFVLLCMIAPMRLALADRLGRWFGAFLLITRPRSVGLARYLPWLAYIAGALIVLGAASATRRHQTQLSSEILRMWLVFGASWFFLVRGETALALSAGGPGSSGGFKGGGFAFLAPLVFVLCVPVAGLVLTDDFGPLFVMLYGASIFFGAAFAFAFFDLAGYRRWLGAAVGVLAAGAWVYLVTYALYALPAPLARIAERLATVRSPFTATNDQLAIITWFQESAPPEGYGLGSVPWCGEGAGTGCAVPRQVQSDYIFTAFAGVYGKVAALGLVALLAFWLVRLVVHHSRATRGVVALGSPAATQQAWLSWISVCWVGLTLAQLMITVAGNLGWLPLTGITFPFASFGAWSLLANTFFLGLAINLPRRAP